ncbi:unnamed protein product [Zymoseptoria tritici ST99CH_1A5]|uniref:Uncharacterized protein n=2 Tax=Zymoseptoria tritici TaxID=1047171 RepID=A0A2H1GJB0_ZYMTR|nr:unnamed protein product [Zymoseptoria tritici ST99CH_1E4]SMR55987.1 unnamed protein product [Zymoseptoria tritici ST99CH_3D1]SMY25169.1 unnamed protein product [Zymoseptoria tritici ST99CH_1A5]
MRNVAFGADGSFNQNGLGGQRSPGFSTHSSKRRRSSASHNSGSPYKVNAPHNNNTNSSFTIRGAANLNGSPPSGPRGKSIPRAHRNNKERKKDVDPDVPKNAPADGMTGQEDLPY